MKKLEAPPGSYDTRRATYDKNGYRRLQVVVGPTENSIHVYAGGRFQVYLRSEVVYPSVQGITVNKEVIT